MKSKNRAKVKRSIRQTSKQSMATSLTSSSAAGMSSNPKMKANQRVKRTKQTTTVPPITSSAAGMSSMFNQAQNTHIIGGSFSTTTNFNTVNERSLDVPHKRVAPNAILNAGGRADEVKCHPGTRDEVMGLIEKWGDAQDGLAVPIFWLSGPAGAGKSAIVQTIAERCNQRGVPHANFFFFRADTSRSDASPLMATLLHQIILLYPALRDPVATILSVNPLIFDSVLENQLVQLIVTPLRAIQQSSSTYRPLILLIDGLDECDSESKRGQQQILRAFDKVLAEYPSLFRLLVASRDESQIQAAFNTISSQCLRLYLDDQYSPKNDIRVFVNAQFEQVRDTHPLAHTLDAIWPTVEDINYIVQKSSGQFIYAATVMRFILDSSASPMISLERVRGAARFATKSPFSHLDAIYSYILSQADDQETLKDILHAQVLITKSARLVPHRPLQAKFGIQFMELLGLFNERYSQPMVLSCLADLTPISRYDNVSNKLLFYHASFPDYLLDQSRSREYFVDAAAFNYKILPVVWNPMENEEHREKWLELGLFGLSLLQKQRPGLMKMLASSKNVWYGPRFLPSQSPIFQTIYNLLQTHFPPVAPELAQLQSEADQFWRKASSSAHTLRLKKFSLPPPLPAGGMLACVIAAGVLRERFADIQEHGELEEAERGAEYVGYLEVRGAEAIGNETRGSREADVDHRRKGEPFLGRVTGIFEHPHRMKSGRDPPPRMQAEHPLRQPPLPPALLRAPRQAGNTTSSLSVRACSANDIERSAPVAFCGNGSFSASWGRFNGGAGVEEERIKALTTISLCPWTHFVKLKALSTNTIGLSFVSLSVHPRSIIANIRGTSTTRSVGFVRLSISELNISHEHTVDILVFKVQDGGLETLQRDGDARDILESIAYMSFTLMMYTFGPREGRIAAVVWELEENVKTTLPLEDCEGGLWRGEDTSE
ncbi:hypothetical protein D9619_011190 [Psilocybe cf. subviscida]|uniref:NACHT domain-containing protein n=1 Tax=Psilocybe cf. subviscida TaxID=2480587 RepID=A0A8H5BJ45_9AGAR|nr:hypothetical protein D9619_011190 [Psilocybe cf. subviscida]